MQRLKLAMLFLFQTGPFEEPVDEGMLVDADKYLLAGKHLLNRKDRWLRPLDGTTRLHRAELVTQEDRRREVLILEAINAGEPGKMKLIIRLTLDTDDEHLPGRTGIADLSADDARLLAGFLYEAAEVIDPALPEWLLESARR